jgi:hypothetical protein|tara:strand:+ start:462 stop:953 length:492 start_codon:yes stop_codon:yes gene_type:complete
MISQGHKELAKEFSEQQNEEFTILTELGDLFDILYHYELNEKKIDILIKNGKITIVVEDYLLESAAILVRYKRYYNQYIKHNIHVPHKVKRNLELVLEYLIKELVEDTKIIHKKILSSKDKKLIQSWSVHLSKLIMELEPMGATIAWTEIQNLRGYLREIPRE